MRKLLSQLGVGPVMALTLRAEAGRLIGIPLLDHIIVGAGSHYSLADAGELGG